MTPQVSLIIPTINEALNLPELLRQIDAALVGRPYEAMVIDDGSTDDTPAVCEKLKQTYPVQLIVRNPPKDGLSGAVLHGFTLAQGEYLVVMDADLQHPPAKIPELIKVLESGADFALGSRYMPGGSTGQKWGLFRQVNSRVATLLARPFAGQISDPMSGFFALKRSTYLSAQRLTPLGYKIGLELICKCRAQQVREIPIHFAERTAGESKLSLKQQFKYLEHLSRLYDFCFPRLSPMTKFMIVTAMSWLVGLGIFFLMMSAQSPAPAAPTSVAYLGAIGVTMIFHARYVRTQKEFLVRRHPWLDFLFCSLAEWGACSLTAVYLAARIQHPYPLELFFIPFLFALLVRYVLRKEFLLDLRGLRRELRLEDLR